MICPSESELLAFQLGELPSDQIQCVGEHLTACTKCEERTRTLDGSADTVLSALRQWSALRRGPSALRASHAPDPPGYEMLGLVGGGGMGLVYKARHLRLDRLVALKFLRAQGAAELARFEAEARAVARLQHPHIVQIFEVGQWQGQLFLALEFLDGGTLADHLAGKPQDPRASAQLVQTLARATHCAHTQSIVHRDLKPSNVLVSSKFKVPSSMSDPDKDNFDLGTSNVELKISDFGIAKHLHSTGQTRAEDILGTPGYMAPEQARGHSAVVGPASDIYSLGVILYEMLTGRVPLQGATDLETVLLVQTEEPLPPMRLRPGLPRDLETICLTCLRKEPSRRYASAEALADDLGRMLAGEPIAARPTPAWERAWKWGRRRPATAALIFLAAMVAGVGFPGATFLWVRADHARAQEADHRGKAQAAAQAETTAKRAAELSEGEALAAIDFLEKRIMIAARDKHNGGLGRQATLRQALDAALPQLDESFADQPLIEARLRRTMGLSFQSLGEYQSAAEQFTRARELYIAQRGWAHRDSIVNSISLASCYSKTRPAEAARLAEEALAIQRATPGANQLDLFWNMDELAEILFADPTRRAEAIKLREDVLALRKASFGPDHDDTLDSMDALARCYSSLDRHADAVRLREELLAQRRDGHAFDHPDTAEATRQLIEAYRSAGRGADAIRLGQEELAHYREKHGPDHTETLARLRTLAWLNAQEQQPEAVSLHEELLKLGTAKFGPDHEHTLAYMKILAESYAAFGRREESFALREQRLARQRARLGDEHGDTVDSRVMLAIAYRKLGRLDEEVKHLEALYPVRNTPAGSQHADSVLERLADRYARTGRRAEALPLREELLALRKTGLGPDHPTTLKTMSNVAGDLVALARGGEALPLVDECLQRSAATAMDWQLVSNLMVLRRRHFQQAKDPHGCRETAEMWERLNRTDPHSLYSAAKFRAVTAAVIRAADQSAASEAETIAQANIEADHAMDWLQQAVAAGFRNTGLMKFDAMDLDALCDREDFKRLVAGLEGERETGDARQGIEDGQ